MKIEKVNSNQIKCFLSKGDLQTREIKVSELAYGTEKAQELFKDMMAQASTEFGFEAENVPLMIEAVPLSTDSIMLIITKVENPNELDDKLANLPSNDSRKFKKKETATKEESIHTQEPDEIHNTINTFLVYKFNSFDDVNKIASRLIAFPIESSNLYRDRNDHKYYLTLFLPVVDRKSHRVLRGSLSEYAEQVVAKKPILSYYDEHFETIIKETAVEILCTI